MRQAAVAVVVGVAVLALACDGRRSGEPSAGPAPGGNTPTVPRGGPSDGVPGTPTPTPPVDCSSGTELWLTGVGVTPVVKSLELTVASVTATLDGAPLAVQDAASGTYRLLGLSPIFVPLGKIQIPPGTTELVQATLTLSSATVVTGAVGQVVPIRTAPIRFFVRPEPLAPGDCVSVVRLDVGRSILPDPEGGYLFLPQFTVRYY